jgi:ferrous iron transport protein A
MDNRKNQETEEKRPQRQYTSSNSFPLPMAHGGERLRIVGFQGGRGFQEKLLSMGLNIGDEIKIMEHQRRGAAIVLAKGETRYILGGGMALKVSVQTI